MTFGHCSLHELRGKKNTCGTATITTTTTQCCLVTKLQVIRLRNRLLFDYSVICNRFLY